MRITRTLSSLVALGLLATPLLAQQTLTGAGATFPAPIYQRWFTEYARTSQVQINYQAIGSGGGIRQYTAGTVDFGATDGPMTDSMIAAVQGNVVHLPTVLGAVVITYNLPSLGATKLQMDGATIADIYLGRIVRWNDPRIASLNPGVTLPATDIVVVHRSDGSGTSYVFTDFLAKVSADWKSTIGTSTAVNWPTGLGGKGNDGVTQQVQQLEGSIGYVELVYATANHLPYAAVKNAAGAYVLPTLGSVTAAAAGARLEGNTDFRVSITNAPGRASYPISSFTWLLIKKDNPDATKAKQIRDFLNYMTTDAAQEMAGTIGYAPLPKPVLALVKARIRTLTAAGRPIR
ncbi:MAG: phosphate ABC transporter substrate-binding protein PstS [Gemmatimonadetes bacterium]|nr:phosphate ABC transporter substrate-binding protein PstS [Gemmatimonadota bacterium]